MNIHFQCSLISRFNVQKAHIDYTGYLVGRQYNMIFINQRLKGSSLLYNIFRKHAVTFVSILNIFRNIVCMYQKCFLWVLIYPKIQYLIITIIFIYFFLVLNLTMIYLLKSTNLVQMYVFYIIKTILVYNSSELFAACPYVQSGVSEIL